MPWPSHIPTAAVGRNKVHCYAAELHPSKPNVSYIEWFSCWFLVLFYELNLLFSIFYFHCWPTACNVCKRVRCTVERLRLTTGGFCCRWALVSWTTSSASSRTHLRLQTAMDPPCRSCWARQVWPDARTHKPSDSERRLHSSLQLFAPL